MAECPKGYPRLAAFLSSDENFMIYRRFGFLQSRLILYKQDTLRALEDELVALDLNDDPRRLRSRARDDNECADRKELIGRITIAFNDYGKIVSTSQERSNIWQLPS